MHYEEYPLVRIIERIKIMRDSIDSLDDWVKYQNAFKNCKEMGLENFVEKVLAFNLPLEKIVDAFECQFLKCWLGKVFSERESLNKFCGEDHEKIIQEFQLLDKKQIELAKIRIRHRLSGKVDKRYVPSRNSELGILLREFKKMRAHLPIRKLFEKAPNLILELKPCLMMSPLTVAQFLNPELIKFDLVIFDEASQIPPEESIGAILRGKQVVVAGDTKQLPPTTFFQSEVLTPEDEDSPEVEELSDLDSILDVCELSSIPKVMLRWHYRSKHEHLIAFSNKEFYNNRLFTFPCAEESNPKLGIKFHYIPDAIYDRGGKGTNIKEAIEVAKAVFKHFKETPELSLGVGTFSIRQKFLIEEIIEKMLKEDNSLELFFSRNRPEHFFVKNLETIQGDERDVIFISVGYGKDQSGKLSLNFGPLNKMGGERRLNVLITRARMRVEIFSSIRGDDINLSKTDSEGVRLLKKYLDFAEKGSSVLIDEPKEEGISESPFEESVYNLLVKNGIKVKRQVGCSGYRIDLAVIDDKKPGKYILGIECDGATYHSSATARDRDRLRQQVLESLGWNIYRIWSTDWFKNPRKEFEKLLKVIEEAKKGNFSKKKLKINLNFSEIKCENNEKFSDTNQVQIKKYQLTPIDKKLPSESFYEWGNTPKIAFILKKIVNFEGPIHREEAWRRVIQHYGIRTIGKRIRRILRSVEKYCLSKEMFKLKENFYWSQEMSRSPIRRRDFKKIPKDIKLIAPEEIGETALFVLRKEYSISMRDLVHQVAYLMGFDRVTEEMSNYIKQCIKLYEKHYEIINKNGKLYLAKEIILPCKFCGQKLRFPNKRLIIICPKCKKSFSYIP